ncbi:MAG: fused MFS/spermidine synthase [Methylococcaceae bacterium]|nr:fused MFS/spermidine synthase [Methylococcaceae bacterium]
MNQLPLHRYGRLGLYLTVFVTGASVMVIELLGTRLIAPFYGASLYVWSALIAVTMIALAVGYFIGGRWADNAQRTGLSMVIGLAGLLTLLIPGLARPVLLATDPLGLRLGALTSAMLLFAPSLSLLGMVGPFAIKLATNRLEGIGANSGSIYAVSTLGSVAGTLLLGFYLFPLVGSREILLGLGCVLLLLAVIVALYEHYQLKLNAALVSSLLLVAIGLAFLPKIIDAGSAETPASGFQIQSEQESLYGKVRVIDQAAHDLRILTSDASAIGAANISDGQSRLSYQDIVGLLPAMVPNMRRALIVGLGAGHMAKVLHDQYGIVTDTLEIDPAVAIAAQDYFGFKPTGRAIVGDARYEIRHLTGPYDLIIHDCFTGGTEPAHLLTVETLTQLRGLLANNGLLALNFVAFANGQSKALASVSQTLAAVFSQQVLFISEPGKDFNDFIFIAAKHSIDTAPNTLRPEQTAWLKERRHSINNSKGVVLTDNLNPLEYLQTAKAEYYRRFVVDWLGADLLVR